MKSLAINGGKPLRPYPFPSWPVYEKNEIAVVKNIMLSGKVNYWTGEQGRFFEEEFASEIGVSHAVGLMNGSVALEAALIALDVGNGDEIIVSPRSFVASASCISLRNARAVFADVDLESQNITAESIEKVITSQTKGIITVHLAGWPCEMDKIIQLAEKYNLFVIEDCAQAMGAIYKGKKVGSFGDMAAFSFCQDKIITTGGEGGMAATNNHALYQKVWSYKDHGKKFDSNTKVAQSGHQFRWLHDSFGTNLRMTEIQAAIGRKQLLKLSDWVRKRRVNAEILTKGFMNITSLRVTVPPEHIKHAYYKYYAFLKPEKIKPEWKQEKIIAAINAEGIPCFYGSCGEIYMEKAFADKGLQPKNRLPNAKMLGETSLMFLVHPTLSEEDMYDTVDAVKKVMMEASVLQ